MFVSVFERMRNKIEKYRLCKDINDFPVATISIDGVFECKMDNIEKCIKKANDCLYEAKNSGKDKSITVLKCD